MSLPQLGFVEKVFNAITGRTTVKKDRNIPISLEAEDFIVGLSLVYNISRMQVVDMLVSHARVKFASL